jgi:hypothetical protein
VIKSADKLSAECDQQFYYKELSNEKCATLERLKGAVPFNLRFPVVQFCRAISTDILQRGPKATSLVPRSSCGRCAQHLRRIRGFDDTRIRRESGAYVTQMLRAKYANVARTCRARSAQQGMLLLDSSGLFVINMHRLIKLPDSIS